MRLAGGRKAVLHSLCVLGEADLLPRDTPPPQELGSLQILALSLTSVMPLEGKPPMGTSDASGQGCAGAAPQPLPKSNCKVRGTVLGQ